MAERDVLAVVAAPGEGNGETKLPASALIVEVERAQPRVEVDLELPPPLAEPRLDFRVDKASALAYEVKQGVHPDHRREGQAVLDFLAFHENKLQQGLEASTESPRAR